MSYAGHEQTPRQRDGEHDARSEKERQASVLRPAHRSEA